jgi:hypothetical protein
MLSLLVDKGWTGNRRVVERPNMNSPWLLIYGAAIAVAALLIIGGLVLATADFGASSHPPPIVKERIRLM